MRLVTDNFNLSGISGWVNFQAEQHPDNKVDYGIKFRLYDETGWTPIDRKSLEFIIRFANREFVVNGLIDTISLNCGGYILCKELTGGKVLISIYIHDTPLSFRIDKSIIAEQLKDILEFKQPPVKIDVNHEHN